MDTTVSAVTKEGNPRNVPVTLESVLNIVLAMSLIITARTGGSFTEVLAQVINTSDMVVIELIDKLTLVLMTIKARLNVRTVIAVVRTLIPNRPGLAKKVGAVTDNTTYRTTRFTNVLPCDVKCPIPLSASMSLELQLSPRLPVATTAPLPTL